MFSIYWIIWLYLYEIFITTNILSQDTPTFFIITVKHID